MVKNNNKVLIWCAIIGAVGVIGGAIISSKPWSKSNTKTKEKIKYTLSGTIIDKSSSESINNAEINIVGRNEYYYSEENGNFHITLKDSSNEVRVRVSKEGYDMYDKSFDVPQGSIIILLHKKNH
jgi:hypothetical protein